MNSSNGPASDQQPQTSDVKPETVFDLQGDYWTIAYGGSVVRLRDSKGLQHIAHLLRHPGREFLALDLMMGCAAQESGNGRRRTEGVPLLGLDAQAKTAYKRRLDDRREELDDAQRMNDVGRAAQARDEIEILGDQLAHAVGLGGRDRAIGSDAERARWALTKRIREALKRIRSANPALGRRLTASIKTGRFCAYHPDPDRPILWTRAITVLNLRTLWPRSVPHAAAVLPRAHLAHHYGRVLCHQSLSHVHHICALLLARAHLFHWPH